MKCNKQACVFGLPTLCSCVAAFLLIFFISNAAGQSGGGPAGGGASGSGNGSAGGAVAPSQPPNVALPSKVDPLHDYFKTKTRIEEQYGLRVGLNVDLTSQSVITGPKSPESRYVARYDLGVHQRLWAGAVADMDVRGGWGDGPDVDYLNTVNTNQYAQTGSDAFVLHLWLQQKLLHDQLTLRAGKMDLGDFMDVNRFGYYNFVGYSFAHNPAIPLPVNPLACMFTFAPDAAKWFYISGGVANGAQSSYRAGFEELADGATSLFALGEVGFKTKFFGENGIYRFEAWEDDRDLPRIGGDDHDDNRRAGVAISFDQNVTEHFGVFARWGYGNQHEFSPQQSWSVGFDWTGPFASRPKDDFALGVVQNLFSSQRNGIVDDASGSESYLEAYYNYQATPWAVFQPFIQAVADPGGRHSSTEVVAGLHVAIRL